MAGRIKAKQNTRQGSNFGLTSVSRKKYRLPVWFLSIEVSEADFYMPATSSVLAGEKQAVLKQIVEAASIFFNIFSWKVRGCDVCKFLKEKLAGRILYGLLGSSACLPLP